ncbi:MAG TPA: DUF6703 family protein [Streptosporangiaceae bacterium]
MSTSRQAAARKARARKAQARRPQGRSGRPAAQRPGQRPGAKQVKLPADQPLFTPDASPLRQAVEKRSAVPLIFMRQLPSWLIPIILVALLITGLAVRNIIGAVALGPVALFVAWLGLLSWPRLSGAGRLLRVAVVAAILAVAVAQGLHGA